MRIIYTLLSPTFGMHQYTADLANRMAQSGHDVHLVTTQKFPRDRYAPAVRLHTPLHTTGSGFSAESLDWRPFRDTLAYMENLQPDLIHFTGPHLWNAALVRRLRRASYPVVHTLHDLDPHRGFRLGWLLHVWNRLILHSASRVLVHGERYYHRLVGRGLGARVSYTPLLHLFLSHEQTHTLSDLERDEQAGGLDLSYEPFALFFGRLEKYKGIDYLLTAYAQLAQRTPTVRAPDFRLVLAGPGRLPDFWAGNLPPGVELRDDLIGDEEALDLFRRCSLVVLPYVDATQSALVAAAYFFRKPVLVTHVGALPEYVEPGETGFVAEPDHPPSLARALACAFADPARLRVMGAAGRRWYEQMRAQELQALLYLYQECAQPTHGGVGALERLNV